MRIANFNQEYKQVLSFKKFHHSLYNLICREIIPYKKFYKLKKKITKVHFNHQSCWKMIPISNKIRKWILAQIAIPRNQYSILLLVLWSKDFLKRIRKQSLKIMLNLQHRIYSNRSMLKYKMDFHQEFSLQYLEIKAWNQAHKCRNNKLPKKAFLPKPK